MDVTERDDTGATGSPQDVVDPAPGMRAPWTRVLFIGCVCFAVWLLLDAPSLQHSADVSPLGTRRSVSLAILRPIAAVSRDTGLSNAVAWADDLMGRSTGGGPSLAQATPLPAASRRPGKGAHPSGTGPTTSAAEPTTTTTLPTLDTHPTAAAPLRVLTVGDSIGIDLAQPLTGDLTGTGVVHATFDAKEDTGLSRPDYFNWPLELRADLANDRPQLVIVMMGANDPQGIVDQGSTFSYGTPAWNAAYGARVGSFIDEAVAAGAHVLWVGMPPMAGAQLDGEMQTINGIVQAQIADRPGDATYLSSWGVLGSPQGGFAAYLPSSSGAELNVRTPDGIHLTPDGGERLAQAVMGAMRSTLRIDLPR